ncbi:M48 family metallopeptidase [Brachybacterium sp. MASK1Z-5]|uniref:M48 family metallopeptidase n=1 Tax=Brachybacterium halotolerans TaxID=2795215 RepID=A0ABS1BD87_9MICO|nr:M48 family metallopeptidase [Brachybacterium halotolerans]MBK0332614.1 M48 family metallopeptidase [Brachybacterium halotolerans]
MSYLRALPALLMLILYPVLVIALVVSVVALLVLTIVELHSGRAIIFAVIVLLGLLGGIGYAIKELVTRPKPSIEGPSLDRAQAPALWAQVDELAAAVGTPTVDRIHVLPEANAAVTRIGGERIMVIGLPVLGAMSVGQLRSILAHELGHYAGGRYALGSFLLRAQDALITIARNSSGLWGLLFRGYARLYIWAARLSSREMERAADGFSLRLAGSDAMASAFERLVETELAWGSYWKNFVSPSFAVTGARAPLVEGLQQMLVEERSTIEPIARQVIAEQKPSWQDSHPLLRERIQRARTHPSPPAQHGDAPALSLLPRDIDPIERTVLSDPGRELWSWDRMFQHTQAASDHRAASELAHDLVAAGVVPAPTPRAILETQIQVPVGARMLAVPQQRTFDPETIRPEQIQQMVCSTILRDRMLAAGALHMQVDFRSEATFTDRSGVVDVPQLIGDGGPEATRRVLAELERRGADLDTPYEAPTPADAEAIPEDTLLAALTNGSGTGMMPRDLWVLPQGLLIVRSRINGFAMLAGGSREDRQAERLTRRLEQKGLQALRAEKGSIWIPAESIEEVNVRGGGVRIRVSGRDKELKVKPAQYSATLGDIGEALQHVCPGRLTTGRGRTPVGGA